MHAFTGPWRILRSLPGASYELEFVHNPKRRDKKHASDLSPYPPELIPFKPVNSTDSCYGQLYKPIGAAPFKEAGIEGFNSLSAKSVLAGEKLVAMYSISM
jgi:hypothetical protein